MYDFIPKFIVKSPISLLLIYFIISCIVIFFTILRKFGIFFYLVIFLQVLT